MKIFAILFQLWKIDLSQPIFSYDQDALFSVFQAKIIIDEGWFFESDKIGLPHDKEKFYSHDFPMHSELFSFFILKVLSHFSDDPFLIINWFFLLSFVLISSASFVALRSFSISIFTS